MCHNGCFSLGPAAGRTNITMYVVKMHMNVMDPVNVLKRLNRAGSELM